MQGWIKLHREILESDLWNDVTTFRLFSYLLLKASHKDGVKIQGIEINRGQWIRSYRKLASDLAYKEGRGLKEYSLKTIEKCVKKLVRSETITIQETKQGTLFTIVNYAKYQDETASEKETVNGTVPEQETNGKRTVNNNKNTKNAKNAKNKNLSLQIENFRQRYSPEQLMNIDQYFEMLRHTRVSGKISEAVILKTYQDWDKYPSICVEYGVKTHADNPAYHSRKENYTLGIIRNTPAEEAALKLKGNNGAQKPKPMQADIRDKEIEFQQWCSAGNDPAAFNWT